MKPSIKFQKIWEDDDMAELVITATDGVSTFQCKTYAGYLHMKEITQKLEIFKNHVHGGLYDLRIGEFGPEYASGAFHARFEFHGSGNGKLSITVKSESEWFDFTHTMVASNATLYLKTETALLDNWISSFKSLSKKNTDISELECVL